jgi:hypothetical protein
VRRVDTLRRDRNDRLQQIIHEPHRIRENCETSVLQGSQACVRYLNLMI